MGKNRKGSSESFEKMLRTKRQELLKRIEQQRAAMNSEQDPDDEAAQAVWTVERELTMAHLDRDTRTLAEVEAALRSLEAGAYGICVRCQEPISDARLRALPWARLCLECASGGVRQVHPEVVNSGQVLAALRGRDRTK
jgi:DnaK suppressor protein